MTICSHRWDLLFFFPAPLSLACQTPRRPSVLSPCVLLQHTYPPNGACPFFHLRHLPPVCRWLLSMRSSLSPSPPPIDYQLSIGYCHLDVTPPAYICLKFGQFISKKKKWTPEIFLYRNVSFLSSWLLSWGSHVPQAHPPQAYFDFLFLHWGGRVLTWEKHRLRCCLVSDPNFFTY